MANYNVSPELIEEQRKKLQEERGGNAFKPRIEFNEKNYLNDRLAKGETKKEMKVRILPVSADDSNIFFIINTHSLKVDKEISKSGFKSFICLNDEHVDGGGDCPLCKKSKELFAEANKCQNEAEKKALVKSALQYRSKKTFIVRVIERGHEDEGVKFWRFNAHSDGAGIYDKLMHLYDVRNNESIEATGEPYNIFDLVNGKDIVLTLTLETSSNGKTKTSINITDAGFATPLSKNEKEIDDWVNDPKVWSDMYASKTAEYLQIIADGEIPVFNKNKNQWEAKTETKSVDTDAEKEAAKELVDTTEEVKEDDLPF